MIARLKIIRDMQKREVVLFPVCQRFEEFDISLEIIKSLLLTGSLQAISRCLQIVLTIYAKTGNFRLTVLVRNQKARQKTIANFKGTRGSNRLRTSRNSRSSAKSLARLP